MNHSDVMVPNTRIVSLYIPPGQSSGCVVEMRGEFLESAGMEVHGHPFARSQVTRVRKLSLTSTRFEYEDLWLNKCGYTINIWLRGYYEILQASPFVQVRQGNRPLMPQDFESQLSQLISVPVLTMWIPIRQRTGCVIQLKGEFLSSAGIELHGHSAYLDSPIISRFKTLYLSETEFTFEALYLNECGYGLTIWLRGGYEVVQASPGVHLQRSERSLSAHDYEQTSRREYLPSAFPEARVESE